MTEIIDLEKEQILNEDLPQLHATTKALVVKDKESREFAVTHVKSLKAIKEKIEQVFHPTANKEAAYKAYALTLDTEKKFYAVLDEDIKRATLTVKTYDTAETIRIQREQQAIRDEADRKERERQAEIQRKIDAENKKIQDAKDEEARIRIAKQEEIAKANKAERDRLQKIENDRIAKEAAELAEQERKAALKTEKLEAKKEEAPIPVFAPPQEPIKKLTTKARVLNVYKLCKLIAEGVIPFSVVDVNQAQLNQWAKAQDPKAKFDGIELTQETTRI